MPKRRLGRPPLDPSQPSAQISVRVPVGIYDRLCARAHAAQCSLPELVRRELAVHDRVADVREGPVFPVRVRPRP